MTLEENIRFVGSVYGVKDSNITKRIKKFATDLNFMDSLHKRASIASPGNAKKAMIVRELIHDPSILIIDEPTAFMDARSGRATWGLLRGLAGEKTIIYVSQALPEVEQANDRILVMQQGKIILDGTLDRLLEST